MIQTILILLLVLFSGFFSGCNEKQSEVSSSFQSLIPTRTFSVPDSVSPQATKLADVGKVVTTLFLRGISKKNTIHCQDESSCNPSVGVMSIFDFTNLTVNGNLKQANCTGFLVGSDLLMTNGHCIPSSVALPGTSCEGKIWITFPKAGGFDQETLNCVKVISSETGKYYDNPDYAFLQIEKTSRPPLEVNLNGLEDGQELTIYKADTKFSADFSISSVQKKMHCQVNYREIGNPGFTNKYNPEISFSKCENGKVIEGNSGSPVLDSQGKVRAILNLIRAGLDVNEQIRQYADNPNYLGGMATNLACVPDSPAWTVLSSFPDQCFEKTHKNHFTDSELYDMLLDRFQALENADIENLTQSWNEYYKNRGIKWVFVPVGEGSPLYDEVMIQNDSWHLEHNFQFWTLKPSCIVDRDLYEINFNSKKYSTLAVPIVVQHRFINNLAQPISGLFWVDAIPMKVHSTLNGNNRVKAKIDRLTLTSTRKQQSVSSYFLSDCTK